MQLAERTGREKVWLASQRVACRLAQQASCQGCMWRAHSLPTQPRLPVMRLFCSHSMVSVAGRSQPEGDGIVPSSPLPSTRLRQQGRVVCVWFLAA